MDVAVVVTCQGRVESMHAVMLTVNTTTTFSSCSGYFFAAATGVHGV